MDRYIIISTTFNNEEEMNRIMNMLLEQHLISCYQVMNINSSYHWKGKIENEKEYLVNMKTKMNLYKEIENIIIVNHSYEVPQIICYDIICGNNKYLKWINSETK